MLTGIRDLDHIILNQLEDKDLVNICLVNKAAQKLCNDQTFWFNRILSRFPNIPPEVFVKNRVDRSWSEYYIVKNRGDRSWSEYYIEDLRKINQKPNYYLIEGSKQGREDHVMIALNEGSNVHAPLSLIHI